MDQMDTEAWKKLFGSAPVEAKANDRRVRPNTSSGGDSNPSLRAVQDTAELALRLATIVTQKQREDESMLVSAVPIKKSNLVFQAMTAAHAEYLKLAKGKKGHGLGDGSTFRFGAVLAVLAQSLEDGDTKKAVTDALAVYNPKSKQALRVIKLCKNENMHDSTQMRFKLAMPSQFVLECAVIDGIEKLESSQQWIGPRPAGYLEGLGQETLNKQ